MAVVSEHKKDGKTLTCLDIEIAIARQFDFRRNLIVPNVSYGLNFRHELDVAVVTKEGYVTEFEIKTSAQDLKRDLLKQHGHRSDKIRRQFVAVPKFLAELAVVTFPESWGVLSLGDDKWNLETLRHPRINKTARPLRNDEMTHLYELAAMRTWTLKQTLQSRINRSRLLTPEAPTK